MKAKHASLIMVLLIMMSVGLGIMYELHHHKDGTNLSRNRLAKPLSEIMVPDKPVLEKMDRLERRMHILSSPPPRVVRQIDLSALGYVPVSPVRTDIDAGKPRRALSMDHRVTMAFDGRVNRFCIIDSKLYPEGAVLPDGATIVKIESRRVLIAKESLQKWLDVDPLIVKPAPEESS